MVSSDLNILYVGARLPLRSETFVYREVLELRARGANVVTASVNHPEENLGTADLDRLADQTIPIYPLGVGCLLTDALKAFVSRPMTSSKMLVRCLADASFGQGVPLKRRPKLIVQGVAGLALVHRLNDRGILPDHIHAHMAHVPTSIAMYTAMVLGVPFSFTGHAADLFRDFSLLNAKLTRAAFVSCISEWHRDYYKTCVRCLDDSKLPVVRCGVDTSKFKPLDSRVTKPFRILAVGRLVEKKGFDILIHACERLAARGHDFQCTIVGDGPEQARLESIIQEHRLEDRVVLTGGMDNEKIRSLMAESDAFVLPCREAKSGDRDGIPVVLMEAMASGLPVISGDLITIRELVIHGKTGLMVAPESVESLADSMDSLIQDERLRKDLAVGGRERVVNEFSLRENVDRLIGAFHRDKQITTTHTYEASKLCPTV